MYRTYGNIETVYTLEQAEKILNRNKLSRRIKRALRRLINRYRAEIITYLKSIVIGMILLIAFVLWLGSTGKFMDVCIIGCSFVSVIWIVGLRE